MNNRADILTPVGGRLVLGSLYEPQTTDAENRPLVIKTGPNAGQPRVDYFFAVAIPKGSGAHWSQTDWGIKIQAVGLAGFPNGQTQSPLFAWKVVDGDSQIPNKVGKKPVDREGYAGHWVLHFSGGFAPSLVNNDGTKQLLEPNAINLGDYVQVFGSVTDNGSQQQPGVFLNHRFVALTGYGPRIVSGPDAKTVGFGGALPAGASATPVAGGFNPAPITPTVTPVLPTPIQPYHPILQPGVMPVPPVVPPPAAPVRVMLPTAQGATYEQLIANGWTDVLLIQHGMMQA